MQDSKDDKESSTASDEQRESQFHEFHDKLTETESQIAQVLALADSGRNRYASVFEAAEHAQKLRDRLLGNNSGVAQALARMEQDRKRYASVLDSENQAQKFQSKLMETESSVSKMLARMSHDLERFNPVLEVAEHAKKLRDSVLGVDSGVAKALAQMERDRKRYFSILDTAAQAQAFRDKLMETESGVAKILAQMDQDRERYSSIAKAAADASRITQSLIHDRLSTANFSQQWVSAISLFGETSRHKIFQDLLKPNFLQAALWQVERGGTRLSETVTASDIDELFTDEVEAELHQSLDTDNFDLSRLSLPARKVLIWIINVWLVPIIITIWLAPQILEWRQQAETKLTEAETPREVRRLAKCLSGDEASSLEDCRIVVGDDLRLRDAPSRSSEVLALLPLGKVVEVLSAPRGPWLFVEVSLDGEHIQGWVARRYTTTLSQ
ncbi:SH3 domain-containing protein [Marinobacterium rhizophilum]|uniref:SH3 domain-containing protein n=1 Tax=Marinobacterium rhizophilum TaxID=420402 RepID=UPI00037D4729|nr:SH3 domain-containing protein [Marinobacterium rhizophilum]